MTPAGEGARTPTQWRRLFGRRLAALDAAIIGASSLLAYAARQALGEVGVVGELATEIPVALAVLPMWLAIFAGLGAYRPEYLNSGGDAFRRFSAGVVGGILALGFVSFVLDLRLSRLYVVFLLVLVFVLGGTARLGLRWVLARRYAQGELVQRVLFAGADDAALGIVDAIATTEGSGYQVVGFLDEQLAVGETREGLPILGRPEHVLRVASLHRIGLVVVSPTGVSPGVLRDLTIEMEGSDVDLALAPSPFAVVSRRMTVESVANVPILHVDQIRLDRGRALAKRSLDIVVSTALAVVTLPIAAVAALAIRLEDRGPALFRQQRVGKDGAPFTIYKFRTMVPDAEARLQEIEHLNEAGHAFFKVRRDPRITRVGAFLRKWSIDELPQLWNVLRGDMSMVGPRPPLPSEVEDYQPWQLRRLRVRPGITGVWQVSGRSNVPFEEAVRLDLFYIENWSLGYDLFLLGKTVLAVLGRRGAY